MLSGPFTGEAHMSRYLTCIHGHVWEAPDEGAGSSTSVYTACPICRAGVEPASQETPDRSNPSAATLHYADAVPISEADTAPPGPESAVAPPAGAGARVPDPAVVGQPRSFPTIPGYEVLEEIGRGGMRVVLKARQTKLDRLVVIVTLVARLPIWPGCPISFPCGLWTLLVLQRADVRAAFRLSA